MSVNAALCNQKTDAASKLNTVKGIACALPQHVVNLAICCGLGGHVCPAEAINIAALPKIADLFLKRIPKNA